MLHLTSKVRGFHLVASDGEVGHVDDFLFDEAGAIRYFLVDTSNWIGGRSVLVAPSAVEKIDSPNHEIRVRLTRDQIKNGPQVNLDDIEFAETLPIFWII